MCFAFVHCYKPSRMTKRYYVIRAHSHIIITAVTIRTTLFKTAELCIFSALSLDAHNEQLLADCHLTVGVCNSPQFFFSEVGTNCLNFIK